jgi:hypothetical protein
MSATSQRGPRVPVIQSVPAAPEPIVAPVSTGRLDAAVLVVQAKAAPLVRNADGQVGSRYYRYVTLANVVEQILPLLVDEDLLWKTWPTSLDDGRPALRYRMTHVPSGEFDEDTMPLPCDATMQGLGSGITYGRRYALTAYLNLTIDEDDDGASANARPPAVTERVTQPTGAGDASQPTARPPQDTERSIAPSQVRMLWAKAAANGLANVDLLNAIKTVTGYEPIESDDQDGAKRWINRELPKLPARLVDDLVEIIEPGSSRKRGRQ